MPTDPQQSLRDHVLYLLRGSGAQPVGDIASHPSS
jgi:hypothetical protein